ncbi:hypothetical protein JJE66_26520 [Bradyrhizobium diazoefficiens]|uniref:hypothetical protein n=1 Tax=Bradyrhizobium diazoefficiens TaxID=1355477 RepID=UPI00190A65B3|nr:hypothetical protein [Bradyrhizobium diazoefficiens]MBK3664768.1 hypothetical protein [Bradyrhizobium diazoefficiens]
MQKFSSDLAASDRRVVRKWRLVVVGFYGSLLAMVLIFALMSSRDVQIARTGPLFEAQAK